MKPQQPVDPDHHLMARHRAMAVLAIEKPHNEKPIGEFKVDLLQEWLETIEQFEDDVFLWEMPFPGDDGNCLVATPSKESKVGYSIAPMMEVD